MKCAILVLEQPWWNLHHDPSQTSVRHFLEGLARLEGMPIFYATFYDTASLGQAMQYLMDARKLDEVEQLIVYVAAHGRGARIGNGAKGTNLATVFSRIAEYGKGKVVGVLLDSCEVGGQFDVIARGMQAAKINWVIGYSSPMEWLKTMLINLHVLSTMRSLSKNDSKSRRKLRAAVQAAFEPFNPFMAVPACGEDDDECEDLADETLSSALSVTICGERGEPKLLRESEIWPELPEPEDCEEEVA